MRENERPEASDSGRFSSLGKVLYDRPDIELGCLDPGPGEIMTLTPMRHIKLRFAGEAGNWQLADYEIDGLEEGFEDVARFPPTHKEADRPLTERVREFVALPLRELRAAVLQQAVSAFVTSYDSLTIACNGYPAATRFSFNVVSRPATNPYSNQQF